MSKVNRKLEFDINKKIKKNKINKTFIPNSFSFNKIINLNPADVQWLKYIKINQINLYK